MCWSLGNGSVRMIQYALKCTENHRFDSWFQSADAFDKLKAAGMVTCAVCGSGQVEKTMMSPRVAQPSTRSGKQQAERGGAEHRPHDGGPLSRPASPAEQALAALKAHITKTSDYVGKDFVKEARAMHDGSAPERSIHGEARPEDARKLLEDGVPVAPLPFRPDRKNN